MGAVLVLGEHQLPRVSNRCAGLWDGFSDFSGSGRRRRG